MVEEVEAEGATVVAVVEEPGGDVVGGTDTAEATVGPVVEAVVRPGLAWPLLDPHPDKTPAP